MAMRLKMFRRLAALVAALTFTSCVFAQEIDSAVDNSAPAGNGSSIDNTAGGSYDKNEQVGNLATKDDLKNLESQIQDVEHSKVFLNQVTNNINLEQSHRSWAKGELAKTSAKLEALRKEHNNLKWQVYYGLGKHRAELDKLEGAVFDPKTGASRIDGLQGQVASLSESASKHDGIIDKLVTGENALAWWCLGLTAIVIVGFSRRFMIGRN